VVVIGKVAPDCDVSGMKAVANIHFLGRKPYASLPGYCRAFDVALMPFKVNELTLNANPLKVREYLAAGLPVVSTDIPEVSKVGLCKLATSTEDFVRKVDECLAEGGGPTRERAERIFHESWDARVEEIRAHVGEAMLKAGRSL
jgi:glycosyltransferase involved in cell wall biosynthesis